MKPVGLYIHVPFCIKKCGYCDFYSLCDLSLRDAYTAEVCKRLESLQVTADTLYLGGGTPSLLGPERLMRILDSASPKLTANCEITVELNPGDDLERLMPCLAANSVNRISLGMQSHNDTELNLLTRRHTAADVDFAIEAAHKSGISNVSLDVMLGIEGQTEESLRKTLEFCGQSGVTHVSAYMLKIENGTAFASLADKMRLPDEDSVADMYLSTAELLSSFGFNQYEISNFAKDLKQSRHNMKYWNCDEYIGIGPAAHSFYNGERSYYARDLKKFLDGGEPIVDGRGGDFAEYAMLRLRLSEGIVFSQALSRFADCEERLREIELKARGFVRNELAVVDENHVALTTRGFLVSNTLISELLNI